MSSQVRRNEIYVFMITVRDSSYGKVMFSQAFIIPSVHRGEDVHGLEGHIRGKGDVHGGGACMAGGVHGRMCVWWGAYMVGGISWQGACIARGGVRGRRDGHCSGWYASYWNAFYFDSTFPIC